MNNRIWLGPLLILAMLASLRAVTAQSPMRGGIPGGLPMRAPGARVRIPPTDKQSHRDLPGGIDLSNAEEMMAERLRELQELQQLQDRVQGLLQDPDFLDQLKNQFSEKDLQKLRDKMLNGKGLSRDRNWESLLQQTPLRNKLSEQHIDTLKRLAARNEQKPTDPSGSGMLQDHGADTTPPVEHALGSPPSQPRPLPNPAEPETFVYDRLQEKTTKWMMENLDSVGGDVVEALTQLGANEENTPLAELLRNMRQPDFANLHVSERAMGFSRYLSNAGDFLHRQRGAWDEVQSIFRKAPVPSLPNLGVASASMSAAPTAGGDSWASTMLSLLLLGGIVLLLCLRTLGTKTQIGSGEGDGWRLGSWPVQPGRVATRQDVIRAFEYLALLCLGPAAGACHHRELAERLADQDSANPARRHAAEMLAWLYEQARYAPADDALSPGQLSDARHALCLLAGVTAV